MKMGANSGPELLLELEPHVAPARCGRTARGRGCAGGRFARGACGAHARLPARSRRLASDLGCRGGWSSTPTRSCWPRATSWARRWCGDICPLEAAARAPSRPGRRARGQDPRFRLLSRAFPDLASFSAAAMAAAMRETLAVHRLTAAWAIPNAPPARLEAAAGRSAGHLRRRCAASSWTRRRSSSARVPRQGHWSLLRRRAPRRNRTSRWRIRGFPRTAGFCPAPRLAPDAAAGLDAQGRAGRQAGADRSRAPGPRGLPSS